jgi:hypothetical protein
MVTDTIDTYVRSGDGLVATVGVKYRMDAGCALLDDRACA